MTFENEPNFETSSREAHRKSKGLAEITWAEIDQSQPLMKLNPLLYDGTNDKEAVEIRPGGNHPAYLEQILGHEAGHVFGTKDPDGTAKKFENIVAKLFGYNYFLQKFLGPEHLHPTVPGKLEEVEKWEGAARNAMGEMTPLLEEILTDRSRSIYRHSIFGKWHHEEWALGCTKVADCPFNPTRLASEKNPWDELEKR